MAKKFSKLLATLPNERQQGIRKEAEGLLQEMALAELRKARDMSQVQLAEKLGIRQPSVADMEKRTDMYVSTLRALIEGMGGGSWTSSPAFRIRIYELRIFRRFKAFLPKV